MPVAVDQRMLVAQHFQHGGILCFGELVRVFDPQVAALIRRSSTGCPCAQPIGKRGDQPPAPELRSIPEVGPGAFLIDRIAQAGSSDRTPATNKVIASMALGVATGPRSSDRHSIGTPSVT